MINSKELLFVVDENNEPLKPLTREEVHQKGIWHRTSHIWIVNSRNEILCQRRSLLKDTNPGYWEPFFGGHIHPNETYVSNAVSELKEELGVELLEKDLHMHFIYKRNYAKEFQCVFSIKWDGDISTLALEKDEVDQVAWYANDKVYNLIQKDEPLWSIQGYERKLLEELKNATN